MIFENPLVVALWDAFPVNRGHALIVPRRHVPTWFDASAEERVALMAAFDEARDLIVARFAPDGFNIGINVGGAAGQTVFHLHVHLIPRYDGDVPDPRGGVRWVIPARGNYLASAPVSPDADRSRLIAGGADDPLLHCLSEEFARADQVDIAVGFVMQSGIRRIETHLRDFLGRGGRLRLLTGDYLGVTDPDALVHLLDLEGDRQLRVFETAGSNRAAGTPNANPNPARAGSPNANASPSTAPVAFHPKAYVFMRAGGDGVAFVGSSNLSESALLTGIEWSYRTVSSTDAPAFAGITQVFESLFHHPATRELTAAWVDGYRQRRKIAPRPETAAPPVDVELEPRPVVTPHAVQLEALAALEKTRAAGNTAGLVVLATG
jgi:diadenosine tetraphosphate (Ap4A) HIT family hydrolase